MRVETFAVFILVAAAAAVPADQEGGGATEPLDLTPYEVPPAPKLGGEESLVQVGKTAKKKFEGNLGEAETEGATSVYGPTPRGLGESAQALQQLYASKRQHQSIKSRITNRCIVKHGNTVRMGHCGRSKWFFNRLTGSISYNGMCITRRGKKLFMKKCNDSNSQKFDRQCGAWVAVGKKAARKAKKKKKKGHEMLGESDDEEGGAGASRVFQMSGHRVWLAKYDGLKSQLWHYKEYVKQTKCSRKRWKIMRFQGNLVTTVMLKNMLSIPTKQITLTMWIRGLKGTPVSYASKNHVNSLVVTNPKRIIVYLMDKKFQTSVHAGGNQWTHIAVTWNSVSGKLSVFKNGKMAWSKKKIFQGKKITPGGCLMLGQRAKKACKTRIPKDSYKGQLTDVMLWKGKKYQTAAHISKIMHNPVKKKVFQKVGKLTGPKPPKALRGAYLSRQYASQELGKQFPPKCNLVKVKKLKGPAGWMYWGGSGDVHYHSFAHCYYDDQSIGEWTALRVLPKYWKMYPLMVQFRTSPQRQRCSWCQNGAVAYIDGCAVMYKGEKASCGFGGFVFPNSAYPPYCGFNGKQLPNNRWMRGKYMRVKGYTTGYKRYGSGYGNFYAYLTDGTQVYCGKGSIRIRAPRKLIGKISGIAGNGLRAREWIVGPNRKASGGLKPGTQAPGLARICKHRYQYPYPRSPFNGNSPSKPVVKWFKSWQVDGNTIPSAFNYKKGRGVGSFNRVAGQKLKPIKGVSKNRPKGARALANKACRRLRNNPKARAKCIFDYMVLGKKAPKRNLRDRMAKRKTKAKKPTHRSVRDLSKWRNDMMWMGPPSWGCAKGFSKFITKGYAKVAMKKHRAAFKSKNCKCKAKYMGECAYDHFICIADRALTSVRYAYRSLLGW